MFFLRHRRNKEDGRKRLLIISALDVWSMGDERGAPSLWMTLNAFAERGWTVHFITGNRRLGIAESVHPNIRVHRFDAVVLKRIFRRRIIGYAAKVLWWVWFQIVAFLKARQIWRSERIDAVYGYEIAGVPVAKLLSRAWKVPCVSRFQGTVLSKWLDKGNWPARRWDYVLALRMPSDLIIMTNDGTQGDRVLERLGVEMSRVRFWMNGLDSDLFEAPPDRSTSRQSLGLTDVPVLLAVSRLVPWKRVDRCIQAMPGVLEHLPNALLIVVGDGPARSSLERMASQVGVEGSVRFEGAVPHRNVRDYLAAADLFLSMYELSNVGNPLLGAMLAGRCVVALNTGDTSRVIANGHTGVLVEECQISSLSRTIVDLLTDEERRESLGHRARLFAQIAFWSWDERMACEVEAVERQLLVG